MQRLSREKRLSVLGTMTANQKHQLEAFMKECREGEQCRAQTCPTLAIQAGGTGRGDVRDEKEDARGKSEKMQGENGMTKILGT